MEGRGGLRSVGGGSFQGDGKSMRARGSLLIGIAKSVFFF